MQLAYWQLVVIVLVAGILVVYFTQSPPGLSPSSKVTTVQTKAGLPLCVANDDRIPVPTWAPELNELGNLTSEPPHNDGQIVYIELVAENEEADCASGDPDKQLFSFSLPNNPKEILEGGLAVNLGGNVQFANGFCYFKGFFMNQKVMGMHQGWIETYFGPVDQFEVIKSNRFCAEP